MTGQRNKRDEPASNQAKPDQGASPCVDKAIQQKVKDEWEQRFPNDWLETTIIVAVLATMAGAAYFMYLLSQA